MCCSMNEVTTLLTDTAIAIQVQNGATDAFGELMERYESKLSRYLSRFLRDEDAVTDVLQDTFIKAYVHIQSFDPDFSFSSWIYRIAHNEALNILKKKKATPFSWFDPEVLLPHFAEKSTTEDVIDRELMKKELDFVLDKLQASQREVLVLYFYEDLSYKEIALVLKIPISSVGVRINRAKKQALQLAKEHSNLHDHS